MSRCGARRLGLFVMAVMVLSLVGPALAEDSQQARRPEPARHEGVDGPDHRVHEVRHVTIGGRPAALHAEWVALPSSSGWTFQRLDSEEAPGRMPDDARPVYHPTHMSSDPTRLLIGTSEVVFSAHDPPSPDDVDAASIAPWGGHPDRYVATAASPFDTLQLEARLAAHPGVDEAHAVFVRSNFYKPVFTFPTDPFFEQEQWHLHNTGQRGAMPGLDMRAPEAWDLATGQGTLINYLDDGVQYTHPDLTGGYVAAVSGDYCAPDGQGLGDDAAPVLAQDFHGTLVAGAGSARGNNGLGGTGMAFDATFGSRRMLCDGGGHIDALLDTPQQVDIFSNSWGIDDPDADIIAGMDAALDFGLWANLDDGRGGLGNIYVKAAGNDRANGNDAAYDEFNSHPGFITIGATDKDGAPASYSNPCACLNVAAPGGDGLGPRIFTTDRTGNDGIHSGFFPEPGGYGTDYSRFFDGTSAATPLVSGVVALMLEANPALTWRDVQAILQATARTDELRTLDGSGPAEWTTNGAGYRVNNDFGFGLVDAAAAVQAAQDWQTLGPSSTQRVLFHQDPTHHPIPEVGTPGAPLVIEVEANDPDMRVEQAIIVIDATHTWRGDIRVLLRSPAGTEVVMLPGRFSDDGDQIVGHAVRTTHFFGEPVQGTWQIIVDDIFEEDGGELTSNALILAGFGDVDLPPNLERDRATVPEDASGSSIHVLGNDADPEGTDLAITAFAPRSLQPGAPGIPLGPATLSDQGMFIGYEPFPDFFGTETFTYEAQDATGRSSTQVVTVTVTPVPDAPTAVDDTFQLAADASQQPLDVLANDFDVDGEAPFVSAVGATDAGGTVTINDGQVLYSAPGGDATQDSFEYTIEDPGGLSDTATVLIGFPSQGHPFHPYDADQDCMISPLELAANRADFLSEDPPATPLNLAHARAGFLQEARMDGLFPDEYGCAVEAEP